MNAMLLAVILLGLALLGAVAWAIWERGRASAATLALDIHRQQGDILRREISQSAAGVAEEILRRNEEAVRGFLDGAVRFTDIAEICGRVLAEHPFQDNPTLDDVCRLDAWARQEVGKWACV